MYLPNTYFKLYLVIHSNIASEMCNNATKDRVDLRRF